MSPNGTLHMDTEAVRAMAARLARFADTLRSTNSRIIRMAEVIDWSGPAHTEFMGEIDRWSRNFRPYIDTSHLISQQLKNEADEWEAAAAALQTISSLPSYVHPENINSIDPERIADLKSYLANTPYGQKLLKLLTEYGVEIEFKDIAAVGGTTNDGKHIYIDPDWAKRLTDAELAAILIHEGTHAIQHASIMDKIPILGDGWDFLQGMEDGLKYMAYPWLFEYEAYREEAEFWKAVGGASSTSELINGHVDMIFNSEGDYRGFFEASQILHDNYGYSHGIDPFPPNTNLEDVKNFFENLYETFTS